MSEQEKNEYIQQILEWTKLKIEINNTRKHIYCFKREIWWASLGINIGYEQNGVNILFERPVLVIKPFGKLSCLVLPMTTKNKDNPFYFQVKYKGKKYSVILSQIRLISTKRLLRRIRKINHSEFNEILRAFRKMQ